MRDTVLITGVTGFVGTALARVVNEAGARCVGVAREVPPGPDFHAIDLSLDPAPLVALLRAERPAVVFHLAGGPGPDPFGRNVAPMRTLLAALRSVPGTLPRTVVVGSAAEYGDLGSGRIDEEARERPVDEYGVAKLAQTRLALTARRRGLPVCVARPFNIIGPGMAPSLAAARFAAEARRALRTGRGWLTVGDLTTVRDYLELADVAAALWAVGTAPDRFEIVNVCSGEPVSTGEVLREILAQLGASLEVRVDPALVKGPADVPCSVGDPGRLRALTRRTPGFSLRDAIARLLQHDDPPGQ